MGTDSGSTVIGRIACSSCEATVHDMSDPAIAARAKNLGIRSVPAVLIDGRLADCCAGRRPDAAVLRAAGLRPADHLMLMTEASAQSDWAAGGSAHPRARPNRGPPSRR